MSSTALILFGRYPHPGKVKTRLASTIGDEQAAGIYKACCEHLFVELENVGGGVQRFFFFSEESDAALIEQWAPPSFSCLPQHGADLGERMKHASAYAFRTGFRRCIIIGTDVPDISAELIRRAIDALITSDLVIGPSHDGGYYLLGMNAYLPNLFDGIHWSSDRALADTLRTAHRLRLSSVLLPKLVDIDTERDLQGWVHSRNMDISVPATSHQRLVTLLKHSCLFKEQESL